MKSKMAISRYNWQNATHESLLLAIKWFQNNCQLRDWSITLDTSELKPQEIDATANEADEAEAMVSVSAEYLRAIIWVPLDKLQQTDSNPYDALFHELLHVMTYGMTNVDEKDSDTISYRTSWLLYRLYCKETKLKIAKIKEQQ